jgi:hypothetical protein
VILPPCPDELLSSWIGRHADFYAVSPLIMLRHCLPEAPSLRAADLYLRGDQEARVAKMLATEPAIVRRMTFTDVDQLFRRMIATQPLQSCLGCSSRHMNPEPILRSQFLGWRITCPHCGDPLRDAAGHQVSAPFRHYRRAALRGEQLLDSEAEHSIRTWASPAKIANVLLMRRIIWPPPREHKLWRFRVLGAIVPDFDHVVVSEKDLPTPAKPILPLPLRAALLAGVAIVERAGPEMLRMLQKHTFGTNWHRFTDTVTAIITQSGSQDASSQMQLI